MNQVQQAAMDWEAKAIEECRNDPRIKELGLCPVCMTTIPCLCDQFRAIAKMRKFYEANRRTMWRAEPKLIGSWGRDMDGLMTGLWEIATEAYRRK